MPQRWRATLAFSLPRFLPYLLNQAAEAASREFQVYYKGRYGMLRTEWRVLFHIGCYGQMSARQICDQAAIHKTKVSRAVAALEAKRFLRKTTDPNDRRREILSLTRQGASAFADLRAAAERCDARLSASLGAEKAEQLRETLEALREPGR